MSSTDPSDLYQRSEPGDAPGEPTYPKVLINNRYVSTKPANAPFIKYAREKEEMKRRASADLAAGLPSTPKASTEGVRERAEREEWTTWDVLKRLVLVVVLLTSLGKVFTGSPVFGQEAAIKKVWATRINPPAQRQFTLKQLSRYDGTDPERPLYLAIDGDVYDVSEGRRFYGPGSSYSIMAGRDASRAFITGCFQDHHATHDLRGLSEEDLKAIVSWKKFFASHAKYFKTGTVSLPAIDPSSPIPGPCNKPGGGSGGIRGGMTRRGTGQGAGEGAGVVAGQEGGRHHGGEL